MSWWKSLFSPPENEINESQSKEHANGFEHSQINPSTGLPMTNGIGSTDIGGDIFGSSEIHDSLFDDNHSSSFDPFDEY